MRFRDGLGPHLVGGVVALVLYIAATQLLSAMPAAKSVIGGVIVLVITIVGSLIARALISEAAIRRPR